MKKLNVNENCIGCGACIAIDSNHFGWSDEGLSEVISQENIDDALVQNAISSCPVSAIDIIEDAGSEDETVETESEETENEEKAA